MSRVSGQLESALIIPIPAYTPIGKCKNNLHLFSKMLDKEIERHKKEGWTVITKEDIETGHFIQSAK